MKKNHQHIILRVLIGMVAVLGFGRLAAAPIAITNYSFEDTTLTAGGWNNTIEPGWREQNGTGSDKSFIENLGFSSHGNNTLGVGTNYYVFQDTGIAIQPNTRYTLKVGVGTRTNWTATANFTVYGLTNVLPKSDSTGTLAGVRATALKEEGVNVNTLAAAGSFTDGPDVVFTSDQTAPAGNLIVFLGSAGPGRSHFDAIRVEALDLALDSDSDGLPDYWEQANNLDENDDGTSGETAVGAKDGPNGALGDEDSDGLGNLGEFTAGTNPARADTDNDGINDGSEVNGLSNTWNGNSPSGPPGDPTNPLDNDSDDDGLSDSDEITVRATNPNSADTDGDGYTDPGEILAGTSPTNSNDFPTTQSGNSIGINFTGGQDRQAANRGIIGTATTEDGVANAGVVDQTNWNNLDGFSISSTGLNDSDGNALGTTISVTGSLGTWAINGDIDNSASGDGFPKDGNAALMQGFLDTTETTTTTVVLKDITYPAYDVIVYIDGAVNDGRAGDYTVNGMSLNGVRHGTAWDIVNGEVDGFARHFTPDQSVVPNYIVFHGVTGTSMTLTATPNTIRAPINGIQIVNSDPNADQDSDGIPDGTEAILGTLVNTSDIGIDDDSDGLNNVAEYNARTDIFTKDTDDDGLFDGEEVSYGLNPLDADFDNDGIDDGDEDKNADGIVDEDETDPKQADTDSDGLSDSEEILLWTTNPRLADSDGDTLSDPDEIIIYGTDPNDVADPAGPSGNLLLTNAIGMNFVGSQQPSATLASTDIAGHPDYLQVNWNNIYNPTIMPVQNLTGDTDQITSPLMGKIVDSSGTALSTTISYQSVTRWLAENGITNAHSRLMSNYWDAGTTITLTNIPYEFYDVIVYVGSSIDGRDGRVVLKTPQNTVLAQSGYKSDSNNGTFYPSQFVISTDANGTANPVANVCVFENISGSGLVIENALVNGNCGIFGFQIVESTEPSADLVITSFTRTGGNTWELAWVGGDGTSNIEASSTLLEGDWSTIATGVTSPHTITSDPSTATPRFFRVVEP